MLVSEVFVDTDRAQRYLAQLGELVFTTVFAPAPAWALARPLLARISPSPPMACTPIAAAWTGAQRAHPAALTRARSAASATSEASPRSAEVDGGELLGAAPGRLVVVACGAEQLVGGELCNKCGVGVADDR